MSSVFAGMPGADLVERGVSDLAVGRRSVEALLVSRATTRLGSCGVPVLAPLPDADRPGFRPGSMTSLVGAESRWAQSEDRREDRADRHADQ